jgi:acetylornithine deacetylase/succinyl-diaminopimelate desuccinylase-like protein
VIASEAGAKVSFRLVPGQNPEKVVEGFKRFMQARIPSDAKLEFTVLGKGPGLEMATDSPVVQHAAAALSEEYGKPAVMIGCGGSIPIVDTFRRELGLDSLLIGFGLDDDQVHSPNEKFEVRCFRHGLRSHARLLGRLGAA